MKRIFVIALIFAGMAQGSPASSEFSPSDAYVAAGMDLAIASLCLDQLGRADLFDRAFERFKHVALQEEGGPSLSEINDARNSMLASHTENTEVNMFTPPFCEDLESRLDAM